jgi:hypothetical protein
MRAEFYRKDEAKTLAGTARWVGPGIEVQADHDDARAAIGRIFRPIPVVVDDASLRSLGASGEAVLQPGSVEWFEAAAIQRAAGEGLSGRLVPDAQGRGGWDPASAYRTFRQSVNLLLEGSPATPSYRP